MATVIILLTSGTSWLVPWGITTVQVELYAAPGGGGGTNATGGGGGGAGGCYVINPAYTVTPGATVAYAIGAHGTGGAGAANGVAGGDTTFDTATLVAKGGTFGQSHTNGFQGGTGSTTGCVTGSGGTAYRGGSGSAGTTAAGNSGAGGGNAGSTGAGGDAVTTTAGGATADSTGNGGAGRTTSGTGNAGTGGGGSGGYNSSGSTSRTGGAGSTTAQIRITYTVTPVAPRGATNPCDLWLKPTQLYHDNGVTLCTNTQTAEVWKDASGWGWPVLQATAGNRPTFTSNVFNSVGGATFSGSSQYFTNKYYGDVGTVIIVLRPTATGGDIGVMGADFDASHVGAYYVKLANSATNSIAFARCTTTDEGNNSTGDLQATASLLRDVPFILVCRYTPGGTNTVKIYKHGLLCGTGTSTNTPLTISQTGVAVIGADRFDGSTGDYYTGSVQEIIVFATDPGDTDVATIVSSMESDYALKHSPPATGYYGSFFNNTGGSADQNLYMVQSTDGINWSWTPCNYQPHSSNQVRDPSVSQLGASLGPGTWILCHTNTTGAPSTSFDWGYGSDGQAWTYGGTVDCSSVTGAGSGASTFAPEWFLDGAAPQGVRVFVSLSSDGTTFHFYETHPTNSVFTSWSALTQVTGTGLPTGLLDADMHLSGGTYYLATSSIDILSSSSLTSGYTVDKSGDWAGWNATIGGNLEGPSFLEQPSGTWNAWIDASGSGIWYSHTTSGGIDGTYNTAVITSAPFTMQHGTVMYLAPAFLTPRPYVSNQAVKRASIY